MTIATRARPRGVPYRKLKRAEADMRTQYPHAYKIHALWTPSSCFDIHVEVFLAPGRASVVGWEPSR